MNSFGRRFRVTLWGESHGKGVGVSLDGVPAGIALCEADFEEDLARRRSGAAGTTPRKESDLPTIMSGVYRGYTTGAPLTIQFINENTRSEDYNSTAQHFRPSHADWVADQKFEGFNDPRGGGHFSARITLALVAAGVVAKRILSEGVRFHTRLTEVGGQSDPEQFSAAVVEAASKHDSIGGVVECRVEGLQVGVGSPFFDSIESVASHLIFSIPAVRGVEFGRGFEAARMRGSEHNDMICSESGQTQTNNAGGVVGGISNGNEIVVRVAFKPTPSIGVEQHTYSAEQQVVAPLKIVGRHDACVALRAGVIVEAAMAIALADLSLLK